MGVAATGFPCIQQLSREPSGAVVGHGKMIAQCTQSGKSINTAMDWAESEIEGFMRT